VFEQVATKLRYYNYNGVPIRALPFIGELTGQNIDKIQTHNVFVRKIPKDPKDKLGPDAFGSKQLEESFKNFGEILSCKVSINENYRSRGYGFVCFKEPEVA